MYKQKAESLEMVEQYRHLETLMQNKDSELEAVKRQLQEHLVS